MSNYNAKVTSRIAQKDYYNVCDSDWAHDRSIYKGEEYVEVKLYPAYLSNAKIITLKRHVDCLEE